MAEFALAVVLGYLLGAVPSGLIVGKLYRGIDIREYGSGKTGAANALRTLGWKGSATVFVLDLLKGVIPVLLAHSITGSELAAVISAAAAIVGHNWSLFISFQGGRGVVTGFGAFLVLSPPAALFVLAVGVSVIALSRYVSLGSVVGAVTAVASALFMLQTGRASYLVLAFIAFVAALVIFQHRDNLVRLWQGTERKLGQRAERRNPLPSSTGVRQRQGAPE